MGFKSGAASIATLALILTAPAAAASGNGRLAYAVGDSVYTINPDGTGAAVLHTGLLPAYSPDGTKIAYADRPPTGGGAFTIWVADADGSSAHEIGTSVAPRPFVWSPDGSRVAFFSGDAAGGFSLLVANADGSGMTSISPDAYGSGAPSWSPDGTQLAFSTTNEADIAVAKADGSGRYLPIQDGTRDAAPSWSPDGSHIAFFRETFGSFVLYSMRPDGSGLHQLGRATADDTRAPQWSPDGSRLVFGSREQTGYSRFGPYYSYNVYTVGADGAGERRLTDSWSYVAGVDPVWSPDGQRIAFTSARGRTGGATYDTVQLFVMNADGTCETQLSSGTSPVSAPSWQALASGPPADPLRCAALSLKGTLGVNIDEPALDDSRIYIYRGVLQNTGNVTSDPIHLFTSGPSPFLYVSMNAPNNGCTVGSDVSCTLPPLPPGGTAAIEIRFLAFVSGGYQFNVTATGTGSTPDGDLSDNVDPQYRQFPFCEISTKDGSTLRAGGDDDLICGTIGRDTIFAAGGNDLVFGGLGRDVIHAGSGDDQIDGGGGTDYVYGDNGKDKLRGGFGDDVLIGGNGNDSLWGESGGDYLKGGPGVDRFFGGDGNDLIDSRDGLTEHVYCGYGTDRVQADLHDKVSSDCEQVVRRATHARAPR